MDKRVKVLAFLALLSVLMYVSVFSRKVEAQATTIYVSPSESTLAENISFRIDVNVKFVWKMDTYQVYLWWNPALLNVTSVVKGTFLSNNSQISTYFRYNLNNTIGMLQVWEAQTTADPLTAVGGNGTLFSVNFLAKSTGQCTLDLTNTQIIYYHNLLSHEVEDGYFNNELYNISVGDADFPIEVKSNSTVYNFNFSLLNKSIVFNVTGDSGTEGFVNVSIPKALLDVKPEYAPPNDWLIFIDGTPTTYTKTENTTHTFLYITYTHTQHQIEIKGNWVVPEFPTISLLLLTFAAVATLTLMSRKFFDFRRQTTNASHKPN